MTVTYSKFNGVYQDIVYDAEGNGLHYLSTHKRIPTWLVQQIKTELAQQAKHTTEQYVEQVYNELQVQNN